MKAVTLRVPAPFSEGPLYDDDGLIPGSWPVGLPHEGIQGWRQIGVPAEGLELCDFVCPDDWPLEDIPGGWRATSSHIWDMQSQHWVDEDNVLHYALTPEVSTDRDDYAKHIEGDYERQHVYLGWPLIDPIEVVTP